MEKQQHAETSSSRPLLRPSEATWDLCKLLAGKHGTTPFKVLEEIVRAGAVAAKVEDMDGTVVGEKGGKQLIINVLGGKPS